MNEKSTIKNLILTYGFLLGIGTIIVSVLKYTFGNYLEKQFNYLFPTGTNCRMKVFYLFQSIYIF